MGANIRSDHISGSLAASDQRATKVVAPTAIPKILAKSIKTLTWFSELIRNPTHANKICYPFKNNIIDSTKKMKFPTKIV